MLMLMLMLPGPDETAWFACRGESAASEWLGPRVAAFAPPAPPSHSRPPLHLFTIQLGLLYATTVQMVDRSTVTAVHPSPAPSSILQRSTLPSRGTRSGRTAIHPRSLPRPMCIPLCNSGGEPMRSVAPAGDGYRDEDYNTRWTLDSHGQALHTAIGNLPAARGQRNGEASVILSSGRALAQNHTQRPSERGRELCGRRRGDRPDPHRPTRNGGGQGLFMAVQARRESALRVQALC